MQRRAQQRGGWPVRRRGAHRLRQVKGCEILGKKAVQVEQCSWARWGRWGSVSWPRQRVDATASLAPAAGAGMLTLLATDGVPGLQVSDVSPPVLPVERGCALARAGTLRAPLAAMCAADLHGWSDVARGGAPARLPHRELGRHAVQVRRVQA